MKLYEQYIAPDNFPRAMGEMGGLEHSDLTIDEEYSLHVITMRGVKVFFFYAFTAIAYLFLFGYSILWFIPLMFICVLIVLRILLFLLWYLFKGDVPK